MEFVTGKSRKVYKPASNFEGQIDMFMVRRNPFMDQTLGWNLMATEGVQMCQFPTHHIGVIQEPYVKEVAAALQARLDEVQQAHD
jgi:thioesterase domain-containing protein